MFTLSGKAKSDLNKILNKRINEKLMSLKEKAEDLKDRMIDDFFNHPVTREIDEGPNAGNTTGSLTGYGNLFSFIGFEFGTDPIAPITTLLYKTQIDVITTSSSSYLRVKLPTPEDVWAITPMPWQEGRSWAKGIESGISGLNHYLFLKTTSEKSRSTMAVQVDRVRSNTRYTPQKYITDLLKGYKKRFQSLSKTDIKLF
jgi:hypothetical protein